MQFFNSMSMFQVTELPDKSFYFNTFLKRAIQGNLIAFLLLTAVDVCRAQAIPPKLLTEKWNALWLTSDDGGHGYGVYHFRKTFSLAQRPASFVVHVSGDNRYKLYVNGTLVSLGPARGDLYHWNFETVDIARYLVAGNNTLAAEVWNFGEQRALAQISLRTGFILQGNTTQEEIVNTDKTWRYQKNEGYSPVTVDLLPSHYYAVGPGERVDYNSYPSGWQQSTFDDKNWSEPEVVSYGLPKGVFDWFYNWMLVPRSIPQVELTPQRFQQVREAEGVKLPGNFASQKSIVRIPVNTKATLLLDNGKLTNAYPVLQFSKGKGAKIAIQYAEALYIDQPGKDWKELRSKGHRDEVKGKRFIGVKDEIIASGKDNQTFTALEWRTFRYVKVEIETTDEPLTIDDFFSVFTGYPFQLKATFDPGDAVLRKIFDVSWHTARLCAVETYFDCPYYEQLQYFGDTRVQCMVSLFNTNDDRLVRNAILQGDQSRIAEGITLSRYPASLDQQIPPFAMWWIGMLYDYYRYRGDPEFVRSFLPGQRGVLAFFAKYQQADGRLKNVPYWNFSDWPRTNGWKNGVAPVGRDGGSSVLDFQLLLAYQTAAELEEGLGMKEQAVLYRNEAERLRQSIKREYWDETRKIFFDTSDRNYASQHPQALAILTETVVGELAHEVAARTVADTTLTPATVYFKYYVNQALAKAGLGQSYLSSLDVWRENLRQGLTTWTEMSDVSNSRSDCHAWGASPSIEFFRIVLGIDSSSPGFKTVLIKPHLGALRQASGTMPHPEGEINVRYSSDRKDKWTAEIVLPEKITGTFEWHGKRYELKGGVNKLLL